MPWLPRISSSRATTRSIGTVHRDGRTASLLARIVRPPGQQDGGRGVTFINTEGMSFIGPGSEWFWTALSGLVLAITFLGSTGSSASPEAPMPSPN